MASQKGTNPTSQKLPESNPTVSGGFTSSITDLNSVMQHLAMTANLAKREHPKDRDARIARETAARYALIRENVLFGVTLSIPIVTLAVCFWIILSSGFTADSKNGALQIAAAVITGYMGFVLGQKAK